MARKQGTNSDDPFYRRGAGSRSTFADDALPLELSLSDGDDEDEREQAERYFHEVSVPSRSGRSGPRRGSAVVLAVGLGPAWFGAIALLWAPLVTLARVAMGVHYLSDVLAGVLVGLLIGLVILRIIPFL